MYLNTLLYLFLPNLLFFKCEDHFDVLQVKNVSFPSSGFPAAILRVPYTKDIEEFSVCYRFFVGSFNSFWMGTNIEYLVFDDIFVIKDYFEILFDDKLTIDVAIKFLGNIEYNS